VRERGEVFRERVGFVLEAADGDAHGRMLARGSCRTSGAIHRRLRF
jgi:hypothetical protein